MSALKTSYLIKHFSADALELAIARARIDANAQMRNHADIIPHIQYKIAEAVDGDIWGPNSPRESFYCWPYYHFDEIDLRD